MAIGRGKKLISSTTSFDWKNDPGKENLQSALAPHGLKVHEGESNSDQAIYHIANRKLSNKEVSRLTESYIHPHDD